MKAVFFGTSEVSKEILEALIEADIEVPAVVTTPDRVSSRRGKSSPNAVSVFAESKGISLLKGEKPGEFASKLAELETDFIVVADYGKLIPKEVLEIPGKGPVNVHYSLLPKYRGASPVKFAILNGEDETGVTIMLMDEKLDEGPILAQEEVTIAPDDNHSSLLQKLNVVGKKLLITTLADYYEGKIRPVPQDESFATYAKKLRREDGRIDWNSDADKVERMVRAFRNWPSAWTTMDTKSVKIIEAKSVNNNIVQSAPGRVCNVDGKLYVECGDSTSLLIERLQIEGKREISGSDFLNMLQDKEARFI